MSDKHIGPCGEYCAVVDECNARGDEITRLRAENERLREALRNLISDHEYMTDTDATEDNLARAYARKALEKNDD